VEITRYTGPL